MKEIQLIDISRRAIRKEDPKLPAADSQNVKMIDRGKRKPASIKKKLRRGGVASVAGLSILLAGLFHSPADFIQQQTINQLSGQPAVEIMLEEDTIEEYEQKGKAEAEPVRKGFWSRIADTLRRFFLGLPWPIRVCICIPLWAIGYAVVHGLSLLIPTALMPALQHVISWILLAAVLLGVFTLTMKCLFPHMPLKKILRKRNIFIVLAASLVLKAADLILPLFWDHYEKVKYPVMFGCGAALLFLIIFAIYRRHHKKHPKLQALPESL